MKHLLSLLLVTSLFAFISPTTMNYGIMKGKTDTYMSLDNVKELAMLFPSEGGTLNRISYYLGKWNYETRAVKIKVQRQGSNGLPGEVLYESFVLNPGTIEKPRWNTLITNEGVTVRKENIFLVLEFVSCDSDKQTTTLCNALISPIKATIGTTSKEKKNQTVPLKVLEKQRVYQQWLEIETVPMMGVEIEL